MGCKLYSVFVLSIMFVIVLICFLFSINSILGTVQLGGGNYSGDIETVYAPTQSIKGWINISLVNEPSDSLLSAFNNNIKIIDFLKNNLVTKYYNCTPTDCSDSYDISNAETTKTFSLRRGENKIIGLKLTGKTINKITLPFSFNFASNASESCNEQLRIDITDDNETDYIPLTGSGNYECFRYTGCYSPSASLEQRRLSTTTDYCEKIRIPKSPSLKIGAYINVVGDKNPDMTMKLLDSDLQPLANANCNIPHITGSSEVSCLVNVSILDDSDVYVCIRANGDNDYKIDAESQQPTCGFFDIENHNDLSWDYALFAQGGKYAPVGNFAFDDSIFRNFDKNNNEKLENYLNNYLSYKYNNNCQNGCVIPIRFIAGEDQQITLTNLILNYETDSGGSDEINFYNADKKSAKLNSGFLKLDLEKANLSVSTEIKNDTAVIKIGDTEILRKNIEIQSVPVITGLVPLNPPASVPVSFSVVIDRAEENMSYVWDFGDSSPQATTNENTAKHTYSSIGKYSLTVKAIGKSGDEYSKTFEINTVSPKSLINKTISGYQDDIKNTKNQIDQLPPWMKSDFEKKINLTDIEDSIKRQKRNYENDIIDDTKAVQIMKNLLDLKVPTGVYISLEVQPSGFLLKKEAVDIDLLSNKFDAGEVNATKDEYYKGMVSWLRDNMNVSVESKIYSVSYRDKNDEVIFSYVKMNLNSKKNINELYFVINGDPNKIKFSENIKTKEESNSVGITLKDLNSKTIEFLYPDSIDVLNLPVYISPQFKYLPKIIDMTCNLNSKCESKLGENYENCSDCEKPWFGQAFFWITILLVIAFIVYIILQEWYKRHYESSLFKDKNQLFNLINYINNCEIHDVAKVDVYGQLKGMQWKNEQIDYAWNKLHGLRTGMLEIPLFRVFENNKVKDELRKRQLIGERKISGAPPRVPPKTAPRFPPRNSQRGTYRTGPGTVNKR